MDLWKTFHKKCGCMDDEGESKIPLAHYNAVAYNRMVPGYCQGKMRGTSRPCHEEALGWVVRQATNMRDLPPRQAVRKRRRNCDPKIQPMSSLWSEMEQAGINLRVVLNSDLPPHILPNRCLSNEK